MHLDLDLGKRHLAVFLGSVAALIVLALTPQLLGDLVAEEIAGLSDASAGWLWIAAMAFAASMVTSACGGSPRSPAAAAGLAAGLHQRATAPARS